MSCIFYQKHRNWPWLINRLKLSFNLCVILQVKWAVSFCWLKPAPASYLNEVLRRLYNNVLEEGMSSPCCLTCLVWPIQLTRLPCLMLYNNMYNIH